MKHNTDERNVGRSRGQHWARTTADWSELKRLARAEERWSEFGQDLLDSDDPAAAHLRQLNYGGEDAGGAAIVIQRVLAKHEFDELDPMTRAELVERMFDTTDESEISIELARGFVEGALEVYEKVVDEVER